MFTGELGQPPVLTKCHILDFLKDMLIFNITLAQINGAWGGGLSCLKMKPEGYWLTRPPDPILATKPEVHLTLPPLLQEMSAWPLKSCERKTNARNLIPSPSPATYMGTKCPELRDPRQ